MESFDVLERAKEAMETETDYELSKKLGISTAAMSGLKKRKSLSMDLSLKIARQSGVSLDWLLLGKGEMRPDEAVAADEADFALVPLYDVSVSAGGGIEPFGERIIQYIPFDRAWLASEGLFERNLVCVSVTGDSMMPTFAPSDIVLVNQARTSGDGVFVIRIGTVLRIKRLQWLSDGSLRISSDNDLYHPENVRLADLGSEFAIIGMCHTKIGRVF